VTTSFLALLIAGGLCAPAVCSAAQPPAAPPLPAATADSADTLRARGLALYRRGGRDALESAISTFARAAAMYEQAGNARRVREMLGNVATIHNNLGRPDSALAWYRRSLLLADRDNDDASRGATLTLIGQVHHGRGQIDSALASYREALAIAQRADRSAAIGLNLNNIGLAHHAQGRIDSALVNLFASLAIRRQVKDSLGESVTLNNIAQSQQSLGRPDSAIVYLRHSLALRTAIGDRTGQAAALNNIAFAFEHLERNDSALAYYREAQSLLRDGGQRSVYGITLANLGRVFLALGQPDSARSYLDRGLAVKQEVRDRSGESWALTDIGRLYQATGRADSALAYFGRALGLLRESGDREREGHTLAHIGEVYHRRTDGPDLAAAVAYYDSAAAARAAVAIAAGGDANRLTFAEQDVHLYERWALAWLARAPNVGESAAARASLAVAERGRAQALLDLLRASRPSARPGGAEKPGVTSASGVDLAAEGANIARTVAGTSAAALVYLVTDDTLIVWLVSGGGNVAMARAAVTRDSIAALVSALRAGLGVDDAETGTRVAMRGSPRLEDPAAPGDRTFRRGLRYAEPAAAALADLLIPASLASAFPRQGEVIVVPHGPLSLLPFATLPLGRRGEIGPAFGAAVAIRYGPSLAALAESEARPAPQGPRRTAATSAALVVGNPQMPTVTSPAGSPVMLAALPSSGSEAAWVATQLGSRPLTGVRATETEVRRLLPDAPIVHLATHGYAYASGNRAAQSFIALAPGAGADGLLTVGEMLDPRSGPALRADLVVLSACQTGLGDLKQAEGTVGLQRAFLGRGARSVLVSLWSVGDVATEALMKRFYVHWLRDADAPGKAEALRRAQEDVRRMPGLDHPRFWAAFQLVGAR
jgi:CHAT domain-containing protein/tetratricopeptide (TPR) repeat protein